MKEQQINLKALKNLSETDVEKLVDLVADPQAIAALLNLIENNLIDMKIKELVKLNTNNSKELNEKIIAHKIAIQGALELFSDLKVVFKAMKYKQ